MIIVVLVLLRVEMPLGIRDEVFVMSSLDFVAMQRYPYEVWFLR